MGSLFSNLSLFFLQSSRKNTVSMFRQKPLGQQTHTWWISVVFAINSKTGRLKLWFRLFSPRSFKTSKREKWTCVWHVRGHNDSFALTTTYTSQLLVSFCLSAHLLTIHQFAFLSPPPPHPFSSLAPRPLQPAAFLDKQETLYDVDWVFSLTVRHREMHHTTVRTLIPL